MLETALKILENNNIFITGGAGVGKSYMLEKIVDRYLETGKIIAVLGSTGVAAVNIGGVTLHSFFGFGISSNLEELNKYDKKNKNLKNIYKIISVLDLLAIDEISMVSADLMEMIFYRLRVGDFKGRVIVSGDFYQLPPIRKNIENNLFTGYFAFESNAWRDLDIVPIELKSPYRTKDKKFLKFLENIRRGKLDEKDIDLINFYGNNSSVMDLDPTYLFSKNIDVDRVNKKRLDKINSVEVIYKAKIKKDPSCSQERLEKFINSLAVDQEFKIKIGALVMFAINRVGLFYNGERGIVLDITSDSILVDKNGEIVNVERNDYQMIDKMDENQKILATVTQFPLRLAWAVTIHKSQGMSISPLFVDIDNIFEKGQLYVALSRSNDPEKLFISTKYNLINTIKNAVKPNEVVDNFYKEIA